MAKSIEIPTIDLGDDVSIPQFGLGVFQVSPEQTAENVTTAIEAGYRHVDTAKAYGNEAEVGQAVRASGLPREEIELHPLLTQRALRREHAERGIVTEAWSPLAQGAALKEPAVTEIAEAHDCTPGQVVLRWHVQLGNVVFPKSLTPERIRQNIDIWDFELSEEEMGRIEALDRGERTGPDPDTF